MCVVVWSSEEGFPANNDADPLDVVGHLAEHRSIVLVKSVESSMRALDPGRHVHSKVGPCLVGIQLSSLNFEIGVAIFLGHGHQGPLLVDELVHGLGDYLSVGSKVDVPFVLVVLKDGCNLHHNRGPIIDLDSGHR